MHNIAFFDCLFLSVAFSTVPVSAESQPVCVDSVKVNDADDPIRNCTMVDSDLPICLDGMKTRSGQLPGAAGCGVSTPAARAERGISSGAAGIGDAAGAGGALVGSMQAQIGW